MRPSADPQVRASDPRVSTFVTANAGSGKTSTLVDRVARLLLAGATPEAILCVTYTKAAAAEMQRRLFDRLGGWAVAGDAELTGALEGIDERARDLSKARALFARALETPGGLKIQTLHAFCEKLLRRFPLEAGVDPGFQVLEDEAAAEISARARDDLALFALERPDAPIGAAYAHFSVQLDWQSFNDLFKGLATSRNLIAAFIAANGGEHEVGRTVWTRCGFSEPTAPEVVESEAVGRIRWRAWRRAAEALTATGKITDERRGEAMLALGPESDFARVADVFLTKAGTPLSRMATASLAGEHLDWLVEAQGRIVDARARALAAAVARDTVHVLVLATAYANLYEAAKEARGALDFDDLIGVALSLLTQKADAAWILYKLDGGLEHVLLDEGQDTAPQQWDILRALTGEFFVGDGAGVKGRTFFAVADEKQSIFSFQGAAPARFSIEKQAFGEMARSAAAAFIDSELRQSWRSRPEILSFVDAVFKDPEALAGLRDFGEGVVPIAVTHDPQRGPGGCVELWPIEVGEADVEQDVWAAVDAEPKQSAGRKLARRIARTVKAMVERGDAVGLRGGEGVRRCAYGDFLILVRRRNALFHEIIRALKREGVPVGGADRLKLSEHGVFEDLMALARFTLFPSDDLTLAALLRGPFCEVDEVGLFDLAYQREGSLWATLNRRSAERPQWRDAVAFLGWARDLPGPAPPFDFFSRVLSRLDGEGRSMRQRLLTRMGLEGADSLDAFLAQTLAAEARHIRDLETFVDRMSGSEIEVKREQEGAREGGAGEVRVMTVHGAKGLEAPVVILPDTTTRATDRGGPLFKEEGEVLWAPRAAEDCSASTQARERRGKAVERESARLLYVALTRTRDRLIVCGVDAPKHLQEKSWYDYVQRGFDTLASTPFEMEGGGEARRLGSAPGVASESIETSSAAPSPAWIGDPAPPEPALARYASPSALGGSGGGPAPSPLATVAGLGRYRRGNLIHRLLQVLPQVAPDRRADAARRMLERASDLTEAQREEMIAASLGVLDDARFAAVFGPGSRAEVTVAGAAARLPLGLAISGRMDRLVVSDKRVLVADFKTNRPAPTRIEDADPSYILQMAVYAAVLAEIYPDRPIEAALVWTDGPALMPVPENMLAAALAGLESRA